MKNLERVVTAAQKLNTPQERVVIEPLRDANCVEDADQRVSARQRS